MKRTDDVLVDGYTGKLFTKKSSAQNRIMIGIPMTGLLRSEWVIARYGQVIPCNWSQTDCLHWLNQWSPLNFLVADARNIIVNSFIKENFEWLFFIDHDVILPPMTVLKLNERMLQNKVPMWSGLYFTKSVPSEPLVYRGRGNGYYNKWKFGDEIWVDAIPMGCTMIHRSILKVLYDESESYELPGVTVKRVFETPARTWYDPGTLSWFNQTGTEDITFCTRIIEEDVFKKAGWDKYAKKKFPFLLDASIFCKHIDFDGIQYPSKGEEAEYIPEVK